MSTTRQAHSKHKSGFKDVVDNFSEILPALREGLDIQKLASLQPDELKQRIPQLISNTPIQLTSYDETLDKMQELRGLQERKIHDQIQNHRPINFIDEVTKYNPDIGKALCETGDPQKALARIIRESNDRIENFKKVYSFHDEDDQEHKSRGTNDTGFKDERENDHDTKEFSEADSLSFLDLREHKSTSFNNRHHGHHNHNHHGNSDICGVGHFDPDEALQRTPGKGSNKIVLYSSSKRYVFGFDKVENLLEPDIEGEDDLILDNDRDILKEINSNYDNHNGNNAYKFLNFGQQDQYTHNSDDQTENSLQKGGF